MVTRIEHDELEALAQLAPERIVAVDRKPVAVGQEHAHRTGASVPAHADDGAVTHREIDRLARRWNRKNG